MHKIPCSESTGVVPGLSAVRCAAGVAAPLREFADREMAALERQVVLDCRTAIPFPVASSVSPALQAGAQETGFASTEHLGEHAPGGPDATETFYLVDIDVLATHAELVRTRAWAARANAFLARVQSLCRWVTAATLLDLRQGAARQSELNQRRVA